MAIVAERPERVRLELEGMTCASCAARIERGPYHVFHFIGHGGYDHAAEDGVLPRAPP
jgi:hypothetical protein